MTCVAIIGLACHYGGAENVSELWRKFIEHSDHQTDPTCPEQNVQMAGEPKASFAEFGIPPIYRDSINRIQLHLLKLAQQALTQAGLEQGNIDPEYTDVIFCTGFGLNRSYENYARLFGQQLGAVFAAHANAGLKLEIETRFKQKLQREFSATSHDKVGEMASTIPARIAAHFKLRGKAIALESLDAGGVESLIAATESLQQGHAKAVLIVAGQRLESALMLDMLSKQGIDVTRVGSPFSQEGLGGVGEGFCALVLKACGEPESTALAYLNAARSITFCDPLLRERSTAASLTDIADFIAPLCASSLAYVDAVKNSAETSFATFISGVAAAIGEQCPDNRPRYLGAAQSVTGYTYAASALTSLIKALLVIQNRYVPSSVAPGQTISIDFKKLRNLQLAEKTVPLDRGSISTLVVGMGLHGYAYAIRLDDTFSPTRRRNANDASKLPIAVIGMGGCYGKAIGLCDYWRYLTGPEDSFSELTSPRFEPETYWRKDPGEPGSYYIRRASAIDVERIERNQAKLKGLGYSLAHLVAAQAAEEAVQNMGREYKPQRILAVTASTLTLETEKHAATKFFRRKFEEILYQTAEELSLSPEEIQQGLSAVERTLAPCADSVADAASGISKLVADQFGQRAVNIAIEAACAGSLAAIELAMNSLRAGRCDLALVTGVELPVNIIDLCLCSSQRMLAPDLIATFTDQATGFTPGDGAGCLVLTRLADAEAAHCKIHGVLRAIAGCTESKSVIAPNPSGQIKSMARAFAQVEYHPDSVDYVETHGTGTEIGDQVEIRSLAEIYSPRANQPLRLGALKTRFGHCFAAAGLASVLKTLLAMEHGYYPSNLFRTALNEALELDKHHFDALVHGQRWDEPVDRPKRAAVNAFGTGGINFHLLLEAYEARN